METYQEPIYKYRLMRQLNDAERNPEGAWSLIYSSLDFANVRDEMVDCVRTWAKSGDAFKIVTADVAVEYIKRMMF